MMRVVEGAAFLVAVDIRHSPDLGKWVGETSPRKTSDDWAPADLREECARWSTTHAFSTWLTTMAPWSQGCWNDPKSVSRG